MIDERFMNASIIESNRVELYTGYVHKKMETVLHIFISILFVIMMNIIRDGIVLRP